MRRNDHHWGCHEPRRGQRTEGKRELRAHRWIRALRTALEWEDRRGTIWTDGPRLESGRVGAAIAWWNEKRKSWHTGGLYLGDNKEVFDAEVFALMRAARAFNERGETHQELTIFSDSQAAIARITHDGCGPAQTLARGSLAHVAELHGRGNTVTMRWTPSHAGVVGNEIADGAARSAAKDRLGSPNPEYLAEASLSHLRRVTTERRSEATATWIRDKVAARHRYRPPPGGKMRKALGRTRKELASRYYQLLSRHAATATHLTRFGQARSELCWCCGSGERQTRYHLFVMCRRWAPEIRRFWQRATADCGWPESRAP